MHLRDITFYTPDTSSVSEDRSGGRMGKVSNQTASLDISVSDVVDTLNPLQHIPFISTLYNAITDSTPSAGAQLVGGAIFGGPLGFAYSVMNLAFQGESGRDIPGSLYTAMAGDDIAAAQPVQTADASATNAPDADVVLQTPVAEILPPTAPDRKLANLGNAASTQQQRAQDVLSLFDAPNASAHSAYRRAQAIATPTNTTTGLTM